MAAPKTNAEDHVSARTRTRKHRMKALALFAIRLYKRFVSPYKGFACAYRVHTGRASCSTLGLRAIRRLGVWRGAAVLRRRLEQCGAVHRRHHPPRARIHAQAGFIDGCDVPCDCGHGPSCDLPHSCGDHSAGRVCNTLSNCVPSDCCDCSDCSDWGDRIKREEMRRQRKKKGEVELPPDWRPSR